ncbi:uncharacterized protein F5147DRAFT_777379 [Suillus discolor]|uniref:Uncharacterized protein n=1 Tax=Suillus discolor TaxID=1912936 RepID=A0A9P7EZ57_9AGAM|nr:uncharacterized protein F5147DRAFT_777379 [Suillus discolor]KAG2099259.1 hypothetical protein F5147DRAFT_777379 [Suillus discolor]
MDRVMPSAFPSGKSLDNPIGARAMEPELVSPAPDPMAARAQTLPHLPFKRNIFVAGANKKPGNAAPQVGKYRRWTQFTPELSW